jgi:hypothetical protein
MATLFIRVHVPPRKRQQCFNVNFCHKNAPQPEGDITYFSRYLRVSSLQEVIFHAYKYSSLSLPKMVEMISDVIRFMKPSAYKESCGMSKSEIYFDILLDN